MASYQKKGDKWRAEVCINGRREAKTFPTKALAIQWARGKEIEFATPVNISNTETAKGLTVKSLLERYSAEVSVKKRGRIKEQVRLLAFGRSKLAAIKLKDLTSNDIAAWRDERLRSVSAGSVRREMNLMSSVLNVAAREWGVLASNPAALVRRPSNPPHRERTFTDDEISRIVEALCYHGGKAETSSQQVAVAFLVALETAMRQSEILGLTPKTIDYETRVATLKQTKNGKPRRVPLSMRAVGLLRDQGDWTITPAVCSTLFRRARREAGIDDATFHDARHTAITRLAQILEPMDLARMTGHSDLKQLMAYYNETAEAIAKRL